MRKLFLDFSSSQKRCVTRIMLVVFLLNALLCVSLEAQAILGAITGTVKDASGAAVLGATARVVNIATNLQVTAHTDGNGSYLAHNLPAGTYKVTFTKDGFDTETHTEVLVQAIEPAPWMALSRSVPLLPRSK